MSHDLEIFSFNYLINKPFSILLDESILPGNTVLLLPYVCFLMVRKFNKECIFAKKLTTDAKGELILNVLRDYIMENASTLSNIILAVFGAMTVL